MESISLPIDGNGLRDLFGDRKVPDISRKITACVACRKQKIKCNMRDGRAPCLRCKKRGLSCTVNRSLQMLLEEDADWKNSVTRKIQSLEASLAELREERRPSSVTMPPPVRAPGDQSWEVVMDLESGPATIPAACVEEHTSYARPPGRTRVGPDLIDQGVLTYDQAQNLLELYSNRLDHFLYQTLGEHKDLDAIRSSSSLLLAGICTVGALHSAELGHLYERCYKGFMDRCAAQMFLNENRLDDIRGLCIGAFWLNEVSWSLVARRMRSYYETRLYYLVYVCDHHFSVAYGLPSMSRECDSIKSASRFLGTKHACEDDARLVSQINIWRISSSVFDAFGVDVEKPISVDQLPKIHRLMISLDTWRADWSESLKTHTLIGDYSQIGVGLHFHFAKVHLCSLAFRGVTSDSHDLHPGMEEIANAAVVSAKSILRTIIHHQSVQSHLHGLPLYFDTMIAFTVVFLLKVATKFSRSDMASVLRRAAAKMHRQHLLRFIAEGVDKLLQRCEGGPSAIPQTAISDAYMLQDSQAHTGHMETPDGGFNWIDNMQNFDLLSSHNDFSSIASWPYTMDFDHGMDIGTWDTTEQIEISIPSPQNSNERPNLR
ncbi:uncharacterized protein BDZ99DRAFT_484929 [Mytilinidion resinicola]|uniref:Zn(2)-C6 fungal-type domain-containing protein n=1 Tax=Mytilinidion resinicola TaxID=574789 RepID=A0A6A6Z6H6_9PEZI|nr:uncharacterized protein BDZ99DRAFT_484929 [Mytilinidion resinicola]KAF2816273.1 hypothetical protein BDZ99DRAFT_484929 [Mytilinidion resinicola]